MLTVSPFRPSFPPQPSVFSRPPLVLQPNFCAPGASSFLSMICRLLGSLCSLFRARFLCFHQLAASFRKIPGGVGYLGETSPPSASRRYPLPLLLSPGGTTLRGECAHPFSRRSRRALSTFRMNTCKSVSKQKTLTPFRINTCEKPRGRGASPLRYPSSSRVRISPPNQLKPLLSPAARRSTASNHQSAPPLAVRAAATSLRHRHTSSRYTAA